MDGPDTYAANAVRMWAAAGHTVAGDARHAGFAVPGGHRYLLRRPLGARSVAELVERLPPGRVTLEDPFSVAAPVRPPGGMTVTRMPVMNRPAGRIRPVRADGVTVERVTDRDGLAAAERVIVDGFPYPHLQPWARGRALPEHLLDVPGWRAWLARRDGTPAAAGHTFDDGAAVGVYALATLPAQRRAGLARAVLTAMLAAHPRRTATLVATEPARPLYTSLGFTTVATATWYFRPGPQPPARIPANPG